MNREEKEAALATRIADLRAQAAAKQAQYEKADAATNHDYAFWTQPAGGNARGRAFARQRERERAKVMKNGALAAEAKALSDRADWMEREGVSMAGDAAAAHKARIAACDVKPGQLVNTVHFGVRKVLKVNRVSVLCEGSYGPLKISKEFIGGPVL